MSASKRLVYQVLCGEVKPLWERCVTSVAAYCHRHGLHHIVQKVPILRIAPKASQRSDNALRLGYLANYEKFQAFDLLREYEEIAVVDADVWAKPDAPNLFDVVPHGCEFAAVREPHMPLTPEYRAKVTRYAQQQFGSTIASFYNMGVRVLRHPLRSRIHEPTIREFILRPEFEKYINGEGAYRWSEEQILLNDWLVSCRAPTADLDWKWNALFGAIEKDALNAAHFCHFFLSARLPHDTPEKLLANPACVRFK